MRRPVALVVLVASLLSPAVATGLAGAPAEAGGRPERGYAHQAFTATNADRADEGLRALKANHCLQHAAVRQARLMAVREQIFHQDLGRVLRDCKLDTAGENVAYGYPSGRSVVDDGWMNSEGHRANILNRAFSLMGIGARKGHDGQWYVAQVFGHKAR
jgi:uncharacterized protein YkwD